LVASFLDQVVDRGYDAAFVVVGADNAPAVGLYERAGFQTVGSSSSTPGRPPGSCSGTVRSGSGHIDSSLRLTDWVIAGAAFVVTVLVMPVVIVIARRTGVVDHPGALKHQSVPVPYLGGVAVLAGRRSGPSPVGPRSWVPLGAATVLGVADDRSTSLL